LMIGFPLDGLLGADGVVLAAARGVVHHRAGAAVGVGEAGHRGVGRVGRRVIDEPDEAAVGEQHPEHLVARRQVHVAFGATCAFHQPCT
jgi:hypothetical protein